MSGEHSGKYADRAETTTLGDAPLQEEGGGRERERRKKKEELRKRGKKKERNRIYDVGRNKKRENVRFMCDSRDRVSLLALHVFLCRTRDLHCEDAANVRRMHPLRIAGIVLIGRANREIAGKIASVDRPRRMVRRVFLKTRVNSVVHCPSLSQIRNNRDES